MNAKFLYPGAAKRNACGHFSEAVAMLFDIIVILVLFQAVSVLSGLIRRLRGDVLHHVSKPHPDWRRQMIAHDSWFSGRRSHSLRAN